MLNGRTMLLIFLTALFIPSNGLSQVEPSQSEILNAVHKVDKEVAVLNEKMEGIESRLDQKIDLSIKAVDDRLGERLNGIDDTIEDLQGTLNWILRGIVAILLYIVGHLTRPWWGKRDNKEGSIDNRHSPAMERIQDFAASSGFSGTQRSDNKDATEVS